MAASWPNSTGSAGEQTDPMERNSCRAARVFFQVRGWSRARGKRRPSMKAQAILAGIAGALLLVTIAGSANAQARFYPDGTNCSLLSDAELVQCQNQIYARQLESGVSQMGADPAQVPSSYIEGNEAGQADFVPGAEGTEPPSAYGPQITRTVPY